MLTIFLKYRGRIICIYPFENHQKAMDYYVEFIEDAWFDGEVEVGLTNDTVVPLGEVPVPFYVA